MGVRPARLEGPMPNTTQAQVSELPDKAQYLKFDQKWLFRDDLGEI